MADNLIVIRFILIFFQKVVCAGKCDLVNVFFYLVCGHAQPVVGEGNGFGVRIHLNFHFWLVIVRKFVLAHHIQLFQLCDGVAAV